MKYWINTITKDHLQKGMKGGFTQANHGASLNLNKINKGDFILFYSPKTSKDNGKPLQKFSAIAICEDTEPYQVKMTKDFHPWRRKVFYIESVEYPIKPLLQELSFIKDKKHWGLIFRRGLFEIEKNDFIRIASAMNVKSF